MPNNLFFSNQFDSIPESQIAENINKNSFFSYEKAVDPKIIDKILSETELFKIKLNSVQLSSVNPVDGYYSSNALAKSETLFKFLTSKKIFEIARNYLGNEFRLKCHRVYSKGPFMYDPWHTDDKRYGNKFKVKGFVVLVYLNDVFKGEFQAIKGSHLISENYKYVSFHTDIVKEFNKDIVSFKLPLGSIIIFDIRTIHRAKTYFSQLWRRKSLFFQIDDELNDAEKILINPRFINNMDKTLFTYLGMGKKSDMPLEPAASDVKTLNFKNIIIVQGELFFAILFRINYLIRQIFNTTKMKINIKKFLKIKQPINTK